MAYEEKCLRKLQIGMIKTHVLRIIVIQVLTRYGSEFWIQIGRFYE